MQDHTQNRVIITDEAHTAPVPDKREAARKRQMEARRRRRSARRAVRRNKAFGRRPTGNTTPAQRRAIWGGA